MSKWQPIETAPKDGSMILLWQSSMGVFVGAWVLFDDDEDEYLWLADGLYHHHDCFTHWMPLPEPPDMEAK